MYSLTFDLFVNFAKFCDLIEPYIPQFGARKCNMRRGDVGINFWFGQSVGLRRKMALRRYGVESANK